LQYDNRFVRALIVEDDLRLATTLKRGFKEAAVSTDIVGNGDDALAAAEGGGFDAIILDVMLPGGQDGFQVCTALRRRKVDTPVLMLTARDAVEDRVRGLEAGADDYLVKPFAFQELLARVRALTRRHLDDRTAVLRAGDLTLDTASRLVTVSAEPVVLTSKEFSILEYFLHNPGRLLTRTQIEEHVWNYDFDSDSNLVEVYVGRIRRKLSAAGMTTLLSTVRGAGYRLDPPRP
jgi:two-component system OmpR family response regulator